MDIQERIKMVMKMHVMTASQFADKIQVQRSSVSHILSGRNKPSLDFIEKTLNHFPRVNAEWLVTGKTTQNQNKVEEKQVELDLTKENLAPTPEKATQKEEKPISSTKSLKKIILFYTDNSFESFDASTQ